LDGWEGAEREGEDKGIKGIFYCLLVLLILATELNTINKLDKKIKLNTNINIDTVKRHTQTSKTTIKRLSLRFVTQYDNNTLIRVDL